MSAKAEKVGIVNMDAIKDAIAILESDGDEHGVAAKLRAALAQNAQGEAVGEYVANIDKHGGVIWRAGPPPHGSKLYTHAERARVPDAAISAAAMQCARFAYGYWKGDSAGSAGALTYFDNGLPNKGRHAAPFEKIIRQLLSAAPSQPDTTEATP